MSDEPIEMPPIRIMPARTFTRSKTIGALAGALAAAQGEMEGAKKDSANPFFKSKYADLASVWDAIRGPLSKNSLAVLQFPRSPTHGVIEVETMMCHSSGEWVAETLTMPASQWVKDAATKEPWEKFDVQTIGSAITYARRYGLQSICGVAPEDDDGNAAAGNREGGTPAQRAYKPSPEVLRKKAEDILDTACRSGLDALQGAWKALSPEMRDLFGGTGCPKKYKDQAQAALVGDAAE